MVPPYPVSVCGNWATDWPSAATVGTKKQLVSEQLHHVSCLVLSFSQMAARFLVPVLLMASLELCTAANVLFLSPHTSYSHSNFLIPVVKELANRGHSVTYWNGLRPREQIDNVTQLYSEKLHHFNTNHKIGFEGNNPFKLMMTLPERMLAVCSTVYDDANFDRLLQMKNTTKFDLIVIEGFMNECMLPLVTHFEAPFAYMSAIPYIPWLVAAADSPMSFDHYPSVGTTFTDEMNLLQRTSNTIMCLFGMLYRNHVVLPILDRLMARSWNNAKLPRLSEIESRLSLLITNSHFSMSYQYPKTAAIVEAGGLHFTPSNPLPQDVESFVNDSGDAGFIVLSFGSILKGANLPPATRDIFARVFARIPQRVLWKYEDERGIPNLSANVRLFRWLPPYMDLMAHPKIRLIMTHGGLFSNQEAVYNEVPLIGFPVFGDQGHYTIKAQKDGYARYIDWETMTEESLYETITDVVDNPKYKESVRRVSRLMKDQIDKPLDRAVYWLEYVIRHKGAPHLRTAARHLAFFQRELFDISFVFIAVLCCVAYSLKNLLVFTLSKLRWSSTKKTVNATKKCN